MVLLDSNEFLARLTTMFQTSRTSGVVRVTMKRYDGRTKPLPRAGKNPLPKPSEYQCIVRATCRNKKIATVVSQEDMHQFQIGFSNLLRSNLDGLKKLKKPKSKPKTT